MGVYYAFLTKDWSSCFWEVSVFTKDVSNIGQKLKEEMHVAHIKELFKCPRMVQYSI